MSTELKAIQDQVTEIKGGLKAQIETAVNAVVEEKAKALAEKAEKMLEGVKQFPADIDPASLKQAMEDVKTLTREFERFQVDVKQKKFEGKKTFNQALIETIEKNAKEIANVRKGNGFKVEMDLKTVGNMTNSGNLLSGDGVVTHTGAVILPGTRVNFRDLMPTTNSGTLVSAYHRESAGEGSISAQTEGSAKSQIDFDFSEVKTTTKYISGFARFSKQLTKNLPFLSTTLPRLLSREFFNAENSAFATTVTGAATGSTTTSETNDVLQLIDLITNQRVAKFTPSYILVNHVKAAALQKRTWTTGYYAGSGGILSRLDGSVVIGGVPVIPVDWISSTHALVVDSDYLERVEAESLVIEFFEQDSDNVQKNLITARIECLEEVNPMFPASLIYADLAAAS